MSSLVPLGDLVSIQRGTTYKSALLGLPGPHLLGLASIGRNGGFRSDSLKTYGGDSPERLLVHPGQLFASLKDVTQAADLLGSVARVPLTGRAGRLTQDTVRLDITSELVAVDFLYWMLRGPEYRQYCRAHATGTTNLGLPRDDFLAFPVFLPPLDEQRRIAEVLGAFDDLIEANERVRSDSEALGQDYFRRVVLDRDPEDDSPSGWQRARVGDLLTVLETGARPKGGVAGILQGLPSIGAESIGGIGVFNFGKTKYVPFAFADSMRRGLVQDRDVLVYKDGGKPGEFKPHVGMFGEGFPFERCSINEHVLNRPGFHAAVLLAASPVGAPIF